MKNGTADVSKTISHDKILNYRFLIDITVNNYNLPHSMKGVYCADAYQKLGVDQ